MRILALTLAFTLVIPAAVHAQGAPAGAPPTAASEPAVTPPLNTASLFTALPHAPPLLTGSPFAWDVAERAAMPAWLKWGLIGGAGTAAVAALLSGASIDADPPSAGEAAMRGFAIGFVTIGGGVAVYQIICKPGGWSKRNGLCDRAPARSR